MFVPVPEMAVMAFREGLAFVFPVITREPPLAATLIPFVVVNALVALSTLT